MRPSRPRTGALALGLWLLGAISACGGASVEDSEAAVTDPDSERRAVPAAAESECADVLDVEISRAGDGRYTVSATVLSPDTGWDKYADAWEVRDPTGRVLAVRELAHPHVNEQPFTRSLSGVEIPEDVERVIVAARDSVTGFCGLTVEKPVPES